MTPPTAHNHPVKSCVLASPKPPTTYHPLQTDSYPPSTFPPSPYNPPFPILSTRAMAERQVFTLEYDVLCPAEMPHSWGRKPDSPERAKSRMLNALLEHRTHIHVYIYIYYTYRERERDRERVRERERSKNT